MSPLLHELNLGYFSKLYTTYLLDSSPSCKNSKVTSLALLALEMAISLYFNEKNFLLPS